MKQRPTGHEARDHAPGTHWTVPGLGAATARVSPFLPLSGATLADAARSAPIAATLPADSSPAAESLLPRITFSLPPEAGDVERPRSARRARDLEVHSLLAEGGMGRVYVARQCSLDREVALKVLRAGAFDPALALALLSEARIAGRLEHPGIVPIHSLGLDAENHPVIVMKRVDGVAWSELLSNADHPIWVRLLARTGGDRLAAHLGILMAVCDALDYAHCAGVVHRDVKPDNVLVGAYGETYLTDWGVAVYADVAAQAAHGVVGTPTYLAPEMAVSTLGPPDARTDVYLLGATLHKVLTGRPRHDATTLHQALALAGNSDPVDYPDAVPAELAALCNRATSRDRAMRPASALAFRDALRDFLRHQGAVRLAETARESLRELDAAIAADAPDATVAHLAAECRFGFRVALREWDGNEAAREGLQQCLVSMTERSIAQGNASSARALLAELPTARPDLEACVLALEVACAAEHDKAAAYAVMAHERDLSVDSRTRVLLSVAQAVATVTLSAWVLARAGHTTIPDLVGYGALTLLMTAAGLAGMRRNPTNEINRQVRLLALLTVVCLLINRVVATRTGTTVAQVLTGDLVVIGLACATCGVFIDRALALGALVAWGALGPMALWPARADAVFAVGVSLAVGAGASVWVLRHRRESA